MRKMSFRPSRSPPPRGIAQGCALSGPHANPLPGRSRHSGAHDRDLAVDRFSGPLAESGDRSNAPPGGRNMTKFLSLSLAALGVLGVAAPVALAQPVPPAPQVTIT